MTELTQVVSRPPVSGVGPRAGSRSSVPSGTGEGIGSPRQVLLIVCAGVVLASLDLFIVNVALPQIARDLGARNLGELSWVLNGYAIVYASLLVFFGRLADRYRRDRGFLLGVVVFTAASAACAASTSVGMLVGFRLVQAAGAALLTPTSLGLVLAAYPAERRAGAVRAWTATGGIAAALGPVVGGLLVAVSWRLVFLVNVPVGIAAVVVGLRRLPAVPGHDVPRPDPLGVVLVTAGVGALTFGLVKGSDWGWGSAAVLGTLAAGVALLVLFALHCRHSRSPLVDPSLFRSRRFTGASLVALFFSASFGAMLLSVVLWEQGVWGWSALRAGLALAPGPLMVPLVSFGVAGRLIARFGPARVMAAGSLCFGAGLAWWALAVTEVPNYLTGIVGGMVLTGVGVGLTLPTMMAVASSSLPPDAFATGAGVVNMIRQTGLALGVALLVAVLGTAAHHGAASLEAFRHGWWTAAAISVVGAVPALFLVARAQPGLSPGG
ncbi:MAG: MFS transporter [Acidimicrobiales bacterium]|nr:MFS transporter [Acidimicrobiales bacterium]